MTTMTTPDEAKILRARAVTVLLESFGRKVSTPQLQGYEWALADISPDAVQAGVARCLREPGDHPASPGRLRELCGVTSVADRALLAWQVVCDSVWRIGPYKPVDFDDGISNAVIRSMGGWPRLLDRCGDDFDVWARKAFVETYAAYARTGVSGDACRPLPGLNDVGTHEVRNLAGGKSHYVTLPGPVVITTGLPALPGVDRDRLDARPSDVPRIEVKTP